MRFDALQFRALWKCNDRSHGINPNYWLDKPKETIVSTL